MHYVGGTQNQNARNYFAHSRLAVISRRISRSGFTLIELLVVIAIIAILAVVVVLTLNPAQLLAQSRDANRVSDMATLNSAINLYETDQGGSLGYSLGTANTSYLSVPDSSTSCADLGLPSGPYGYYCASTRNTSGSGWIPINFQSISAGAPFGSLPIDPTNQTSSNLYYTYETDGSKYTLTAFMESQKYAKNMESTGGVDPALYEIGSGIASLPDVGRGLVGYWPLNEGSGSTAIDWSGDHVTGIWGGSAVGSFGYYSLGHVWQWGGTFDGTTTYISLPTSQLANFPVGSSAPYTVTAWVNLPSCPHTNGFLIDYFNGSAAGQARGFAINNACNLGFAGGGDDYYSSLTVPTNTWHFIAVEYLGGISLLFYLDGSSARGTIATPLGSGTITNGYIGVWDGSGQNFIGTLNDLRVYNRALSAAEIQEIYNAEE